VQGNEGENMLTLIIKYFIKYSLNLLNYFLNFLVKHTVPLQVSTLVLLLISLLFTYAAALNKKSRYCLSLLSFISLMLGLVLFLMSILLVLTASPSSGTVTSYGYFGVVTGIVGATIALVDAFIVKPYFKKVRITGNNLGSINIREVTVKDTGGKEIGKCSYYYPCYYSSSVIQCSLRLRSEHFAVPIYARNAIGWVALINKAYNDIELHSGYATWGYSHHYVLDIVGEESLVLFFIPCTNMQCGDLARQLRDCLSGRGCNLRNVDIMFPVRPAEITRNWDQGIAVEFQVPINELKNLRLRIRAGGENTTIYEDEFELREVVTSCIDDYLRRN
jgi:hypothetical protein